MGDGKESRNTAPIIDIARFYFDTKERRWVMGEAMRRIGEEEAERQEMINEAYQEAGGAILRRVDPETLKDILRQVRSAPRLPKASGGRRIKMEGEGKRKGEL